MVDKSDIFHFASFSPLIFSNCVSPFLLPVVSPHFRLNPRLAGVCRVGVPPTRARAFNARARVGGKAERLGCCGEAFHRDDGEVIS